MLNYLVVAAVIGVFIWYDVVLFAGRILPPAARGELLEHLQRRALRRIFALFRVYCRFRLDFENSSGKDLPPRFLFIANHQSLLDIPVAMATIPDRKLRFVAKKELGRGVPFVSSLLRDQGHALVNRKGSARASMRAIRRYARRSAAEGTCPAIFPEGTRMINVGSFHSAGVRQILEASSLPIVVAAIDGGWRVSKLKDIFKNLGGAAYRVRILSVLPPPAGKQETRDLLDLARASIAEAIDRIHAETGLFPPPSGAGKRE